MLPRTFHSDYESISLSPIVAISEAARQKAPEFKKRTGKNFVPFQRGEVDFPTPDYIVEAVKQALDSGKTKYPKSGGEPEFKQAILQKLARENGADHLHQENVVVNYGGQQGLLLAFRLFSGKRGVGFAPCWSCVLKNIIKFAGTEFTLVPLNNDFTIDYELLEDVLEGAAFLYLNTPQNPTGKVFTEDELGRIITMCRKKGIFIISDEPYEHIVFDGKRHISPLSFKQDHIVSVFSFSKSYAMTGWRLGYSATSNEKAANLMRLGNYTQTAGVTTFMQFAGTEAIGNAEASNASINSRVKEFQERRNVLYEGLSSIEGISITRPGGAFYMFPNFSQVIPDSLIGEVRENFVTDRLMDFGIAVVPGACFGKHFHDFIRISFSTTPVPIIKDAVERFREAFAK